MKSNEFITEGDERSTKDLEINHPEIYTFLNNLVDSAVLRDGSVETYNTANSHMIIIRLQATGLNIISAALEASGSEFKTSNGAEPMIIGSFDGIHWIVENDARNNSSTETWRFALPHAGGEIATYRDRTMEDSVANQNWFDTLSQALESEGLSHTWDGITMTPISYGETRRYTYDDGTRQGHFVSIYRDENGRYERPVHYARGNVIRK